MDQTRDSQDCQAGPGDKCPFGPEGVPQEPRQNAGRQKRCTGHKVEHPEGRP